MASNYNYVVTHHKENSMNLKSKKKLLPYAVLADIHYKKNLGVSISALIRQLDYKITPPTLKLLLMQFGAHKILLDSEHIAPKRRESNIYCSFFPLWVANLPPKLAVQQCPNGIRYTGLFPYGKWDNMS